MTAIKPWVTVPEGDTRYIVDWFEDCELVGRRRRVEAFEDPHDIEEYCDDIIGIEVRTFRHGMVLIDHYSEWEWADLRKELDEEKWAKEGNDPGPSRRVRKLESEQV